MEAMDSSRETDNDESIAVVRAGLNIRPDFWDDFIRICGNADGLSELLDVPKEKISNWSVKINKILEEIGTMDDAEAGSKKAQPI